LSEKVFKISFKINFILEAIYVLLYRYYCNPLILVSLMKTFLIFYFFPSNSGLRPGALIGTVRANDIDTFPPISYRIIANDVTDKTSSNVATNVTEVAVDTFTGQIYLLQKPSDWKSNPLVITISASDQVNAVLTST
jgi:hypothetical protein